MKQPVSQVIDPWTATVWVVGDLTPADAHKLRWTVIRLCRVGHRHVVLDLSDVGRLRPGVLAVLADLRAQVGLAGAAVHVFFADEELSVFGD